MIQKPIFARLVAITSFFLLTAAALFAQTHLQKHLVKSGETLYRLSVNYGVTVDEILKYNPGLDTGGLKSGNIVLIPTIDASVPEALSADKIRTTHKVKKKETLWSIAQKYEITVDELQRANPVMATPGYNLQKGDKINIPFPAAGTKGQGGAAAATPAQGYAPVKVAILLPFGDQAAGSDRCIEFYRGLLLAVEQLKLQGKDIQLYAYDEPSPKHSINNTIELIRSKQVHLIVGPLYFEHFSGVANFAKANQIKSLLPFSSKATDVVNNPYLYLLNAPENEKQELAIDLLLKNFKDYKAVFVQTDNGNEQVFIDKLRRRLIKEGVEVATVGAKASNEQLLNACSKKKLTLFIPNDSREATFHEITAQLIRFKRQYSKLNTALLGYPDWQALSSTRRNEMHLTNTYIFTNVFYNPWSTTTNLLKKEYALWFKSDIIPTSPVMFLLGYDSGLTFLTGLSRYGKDFNTQKLNLPLQQSDIDFIKITPNGGYINSSMWFVHYRTDYQIEKIAVR